jgi:hypothetical protein
MNGVLVFDIDCAMTIATPTEYLSALDDVRKLRDQLGSFLIIA